MKKTSGYSRTILAVFVANILFAPSSFAALTATPTQYGDNASAGAPTASVRIPLYSITDWHRSSISDSHPFDQPG
ncbi:hypothetical protein, partial [Escherichia coli]|uniref:hypothetical protein n=1 Tax=Escherichia coli TaxID=562 RepID=UPI000B2EC249